MIGKYTFMLLLDEAVHVDWRYSAEKLDVFIGVELGHLSFSGGFCALRNASE